MEKPTSCECREAAISVAVCIATFRRPQYLLSTLKSIAQQRFVKCRAPDLRVVVVDNDSEETAKPSVREMEKELPWPMRYVVEPNRGISHARNRLVREAGEVDCIAFIDDDETAQPQWLDELLFQYRASCATAVLGPVIPHFEKQPEPWMIPFFQRKDHPDAASVGPEDFRTSNVLLRVEALRDFEPPFCEELAQTGGEDSYLGRRLHDRGERFVWASRAIVDETNPPSRTSASWLVKRRFRNATTLTAIRLRMHGRVKGTAYVLWRSAGAAALGGVYLSKSVIGGKKDGFHGVALWSTVGGNLAGLLNIRDREERRIHGR
jgi:succinoglycan biosynthesis protein ExoM